MSKLDIIREALEQFGKTYYGNADPELTEPWNYTVFRRAELSKSTNGNGFVRRYAVAVVRENYIPEGLEFEIINSILETTNLRLADTAATYSYVYKGNTDLVVEVCLITFSEPIKGCKVIV